MTTHSTMMLDALSERPETVLTVTHFLQRTEAERLHLPQVRALLEDEGLGSMWSRGELGANRW